LSDFGIARQMDDNSVLTATNMTVGSLAYAPPEQLMGASLDGRTDQYALAATAFQLLTGKPPFDDSNAAVVISSHLSSPPPRMADRRPDLSHLDPIISKAMAKESATGTQPAVTSRQPFPNASKPRRRPTTRRWWPAGRPSLAGQPTQLAAAAPSAPPAPAADAKPLEANASGSSPRRSVRPYSWLPASSSSHG
jgi:serine/threonine-protein kinase